MRHHTCRATASDDALSRPRPQTVTWLVPRPRLRVQPPMTNTALPRARLQLAPLSVPGFRRALTPWAASLRRAP